MTTPNYLTEYRVIKLKQFLILLQSYFGVAEVRAHPCRVGSSFFFPRNWAEQENLGAFGHVLSLLGHTLKTLQTPQNKVCVCEVFRR